MDNWNMSNALSTTQGLQTNTIMDLSEDLLAKIGSTLPTFTEDSGETSNEEWTRVISKPVQRRKTTNKRQSVSSVDTSSGVKKLKTAPTSPTSFDTLIRNLEFQEPMERKQQREPSLKSELMDLIEKYRVRSLLDFAELVRNPGHEISTIWPRLRMKKDFEQMVEGCCRAINFITERKTWFQRVKSHPWTSSEEVNKYADNYERILTLSGYNARSAWKAMIRVMCNETSNGGKKRTIYMTGPANSGKSSVMLLLSSMYEPFEIGRFGPQGVSSQFWLDDLYGKELYLGDEALATPLNIRTYLLLLEGNKDLATEVKYGGKPQLKAKPVILACNEHIFKDCQAYETPILARVVHIEFKYPCPKEIDLRPRDSLFPDILKELCKRCFGEEHERKP